MRRLSRIVLIFGFFAAAASCQPAPDEGCIVLGNTPICYPS